MLSWDSECVGTDIWYCHITFAREDSVITSVSVQRFYGISKYMLDLVRCDLNAGTGSIGVHGNKLPSVQGSRAQMRYVSMCCKVYMFNMHVGIFV